MPVLLHARLPLEELAAARRVLHGRLAAAELAARVGEALGRVPPEGALRYELGFAPAPDGAVTVSGALHARLVATCQRCLQPFECELEVPVRLLLPGAGGGAAEGEGWETGERGARPSLAEVIEEELLLALPFLPRHPPGRCAAAAGQGTAESGTRPFAGLDRALRRDGD